MKTDYKGKLIQAQADDDCTVVLVTVAIPDSPCRVYELTKAEAEQLANDLLRATDGLPAKA